MLLLCYILDYHMLILVYLFWRIIDANTKKLLWNICQYHSDDFVSQ